MTITTETFNLVYPGASANDGTGDSLREAFIKVNENFTNMEDVGFESGNINVTGDIVVSGSITASSLVLSGDPDLLSGNVTVGQNLSVNGNITQANIAGSAILYNGLETHGSSIFNAGVYWTDDGSNHYGNIVLNDSLGGLGANLTVKGTIQKKYQDTQNVATSSTSLTLAPGGDQMKFFRATSNIDIGYNATIVAGSQAEVTVWNDSGGLIYINLPNAKTSKATGNVGIANQTYARLVFTAFGNDSANVFVGVSAG